MDETRKQQARTHGRPAMSPEMLDGIEIKRPGGKQWVKQSDIAQSAKVVDVRCPEDPERRADMVTP
jgi:hypothetical protein